MLVNVIGIDPGFASCGHAELEVRGERIEVVRLGVIRTGKSRRRDQRKVDDDTRRTRELSSLLGMMIADADVVCAEALSHPRVRRKDGTWTIAVGTACQNALAWGVVVAHVQDGGKPLLQVTPHELRKRLGLAGNAKKDELVAAMEQRYGHAHLEALLVSVPKGQRQHAYDALAAATACLGTEDMRLALALSNAVEQLGQHLKDSGLPA